MLQLMETVDVEVSTDRPQEADGSVPSKSNGVSDILMCNEHGEHG